jgi:sortase B
MQGEDNEHYLHHTWDGIWNYAGSIFMECQNSPTMSDYNTLIYGHNMKNRSMFGELKYYVQEDFWEAHPYIYIVDAAGVRRCDIYATYEAEVTAVTYKRTFEDAAAKQKFINYGARRTVVDTGVVPEADDRVITLSTCTGAGYATRWVVQAVLPETEA